MLLQVIDERGAQKRLRLPVAVFRVAALAAELPPKRDVLVDDRADRVGRAVELADVVRVGQVLGHGPEELDVVVLARHGERALAQLLGRQRVQLGDTRGGVNGKHRTARAGPSGQRVDPQGPSSQRSVRAGAALAGVQLSRSGVQLAAPFVGAAFQSSPTLGGSGRPYVSTSRVTIRPPPKTQAAVANSAMSR